MNATGLVSDESAGGRGDAGFKHSPGAWSSWLSLRPGSMCGGGQRGSGWGRWAGC